MGRGFLRNHALRPALPPDAGVRPRMSQITIRPAITAERESLEALQWRASLANPNDREALLANPDAIELPLRQILDGGVFVAEEAGRITGFSAILSCIFFALLEPTEHAAAPGGRRRSQASRHAPRQRRRTCLAAS